MKKLMIVTLLGLFFSIASFAQKKKSAGTTINISNTFNYNPALESYSFFGITERQRSSIALTFLNARSGTFILEQFRPIEIAYENKRKTPSQLFSIGASLQFIRENGLFQEISLSKFSFAKSTQITTYVYPEETGFPQEPVAGYEEKSAAFGIRYELGKYFGKKFTRRRGGKLKFGLSASVEPSIYFFKWTSLTSVAFPIKSRIFTIDMAIIPMVYAKVSKKVSLEFKVIPNFRTADIATIKIKDPGRPLRDQDAGEKDSPPLVNTSFSLLIKYMIKEPEKKRRRKR